MTTPGNPSIPVVTLYLFKDFVSIVKKFCKKPPDRLIGVVVREEHNRCDNVSVTESVLVTATSKDFIFKCSIPSGSRYYNGNGTDSDVNAKTDRTRELIGRTFRPPYVVIEGEISNV